MTDDTPSQLRHILLTYASIDDNELGEDKFNGHHNIDQAMQAILALFMECLPEKSHITNKFSTNIVDRLAYDFAFNQAIDITAQHMRALGSSDE